jgi:GntR family phosphonate transport system transcriptional regulator
MCPFCDEHADDMATDEKNPTSPRERVSTWNRIAAQLTDGIANGKHEPGSRLPTEHTLAEKFGVNRHTVRRALSSLAAQGLVRMVQGSGTYVEEFAVDLVLGRRTRHSQSLQLAGLPGSLRVLDAGTRRANAELARTLNIPPRGNVLRLKVLGEAKNRPLHVSERFFPLPRFAGLDALVRQTGSITKAFAALGVDDYVRRESRVAAVLPEPDVAVLLLQPVSRPVIQVRSVNVDTKGEPVEAAITFFAGDRVTLLVRSDA